jgi:hypothetical protein
MNNKRTVGRRKIFIESPQNLKVSVCEDVKLTFLVVYIK